MPMVDGEFIPYDEWFPPTSPSRDKYDDYFMHFNKSAPKPGEAVTGYRLFYRAPYKSRTPNILPGRLYSVMQRGLHVDAAAYTGAAQGREITDTPEQFADYDGPSINGIDAVGNGLIPFDEVGVNHSDRGSYFIWPTREIAEEYMKSLLQAQQGIEEEYNASPHYTFRENNTISFHPREDEEAAYMVRGHYEIHAVRAISAVTEDNVAGWQVNDMQIDPEVLVSMRSDEPAIAKHHNYIPPAVHEDAWNHRV